MANISEINGYGINAVSASYATTASYAMNGGGGAAFPYTGSARITGSLIVTGSTASTLGFTGSLFGTASWATNALTASLLLGSVVSASFASTASSVNTLNQSVIISGSAIIGSSSLGPNENTLTLGARDAANEGGQLGFNAPGGTYTSASFLDHYQNRFRLLKGTNAGSTAEVANWSMHSLQMSLPAYTSTTSFPGTAVAGLGVDSGGNILTTQPPATTTYVFNMNSYAVPNGSLFYGVYLGGTPVSPAVVATQYGGAATDFNPGYPMPAGTASTLVVILRAAQVAPTSPVYVKIANTSTSTFGPVVTIAAGSAAGTYTDNSATVSFTANQRLSIVASNPFVSGATAGGTLSTGTFKYTLS
jgi:hypothetical protein